MADIERLRPQINGLALGMAQLQGQFTAELDMRDQLIVMRGALALYEKSSRSATKKMTGMRFVNSVEKAMRLARAFGGSGQPKVI